MRMFITASSSPAALGASVRTARENALPRSWYWPATGKLTLPLPSTELASSTK